MTKKKLAKLNSRTKKKDSDSYSDDDSMNDFIDPEDGDLGRFHDIYSNIIKCKVNKAGNNNYLKIEFTKLILYMKVDAITELPKTDGSSLNNEIWKHSSVYEKYKSQLCDDEVNQKMQAINEREGEILNIGCTIHLDAPYILL